ncbi:MAG: hypothetical protein JWQ81_6194 [Amycolatopsis sp.]|uniref:ESX secretion-associated protein EspG n=1 Tax=Amycolatopsis sp. TaxID=37632 RepID=UPI002614BED3|nr:ESX secretion-associated protein EspG [Amycolatopsis sp.]MCU1685455.1 hypothetical protein [Amycolatopsis sp.]
MLLNRPVYLPKAVLLKVWEWEGHGSPPAVFGPDNYWLGDETKKQYEDKVLDVLVGLGLGAGGTVTKEFREVLRVLAQGTQQFSAWLGSVETDESAGTLVSVRGSDAVRLVRQDDRVRLDSVAVEYPAESLVGLLPPVPPVRMDPITVPNARFGPRKPRADEPYELKVSTGYAPPDPARRAKDLAAGKRSGVHQFYATKAGGRSKPLTVLTSSAKAGY